MERRELYELAVTILFLLLVVFVCTPLLAFMPMVVQKGLLLAVVVLFCLFAGTVWKEKTYDERDQQHAHIAGRVGYMGGGMVLVVGILYQIFFGSIDLWLPTALFVMVLAKLGARTYVRNHM